MYTCDSAFFCRSRKFVLQHPEQGSIRLKHPLPPLDSLKVFEAVARHLSFTRAAEELCMSKGAVSYQVGKLERRLGTQLFKRMARQVLLTDAGQLLLKTTQSLFVELFQSLRRIESKEEKQVTVAATTYVAARWLSSRLSGFIARHPEVSIVLQHTVNAADFDLDNVDVAIRWGHCGGEGAPGRLWELPTPLFPACTPSLAERIGTSTSPDALAGIVLLCEERTLDLWSEWDAGRRLLTSCGRRVIADANVRVQAAVDGQGMILADRLMQAELASGSLTVPLEGRLEGYGYVVMQSTSRIVSNEAKALANWLINGSGPP